MAPKMTPHPGGDRRHLDWLNLTGKLSSYNNLPYYNILLHGVDGNDYLYIHLNNDTPGTDDGHGGTQYAYAPGLTNGSHGAARRSDRLRRRQRQRRGCRVAPGLLDPPGGLQEPGEPLPEPQGGAHLGRVAGRRTAAALRRRSPSATSARQAGSTPTWCSSSRPGVVQGGADLKFKPYLTITRAQFAAFLVRAFAPDELRAFPGAPRRPPATTANVTRTTTTTAGGARQRPQQRHHDDRRPHDDHPRLYHDDDPASGSAALQRRARDALGVPRGHHRRASGPRRGRGRRQSLRSRRVDHPGADGDHDRARPPGLGTGGRPDRRARDTGVRRRARGSLGGGGHRPPCASSS